MTTPLLLEAVDGDRRAIVEIDLDAGGRIAQISVGDVDLLIEPPPDRPAWSSGWGSFPMAPWAGRLRDGRFRLGDRTIELERNHRDGGSTGGGPVHPPIPVGELDPLSDPGRSHAIHGTVFTRPWTVESVDIDDPTRAVAELSCSLDGSLGWDLGGIARQRIAVHPDRVDMTLSVELGDTSPTPLPVVIGWHPWFVTPDRLEWSPRAMYEQDDAGLPTGGLVEPPAGPWDDCFITTEPARLVYDRETAPIVTVTSDCDHLVVFDRLAHATCVEPQSGPPDAVNLTKDVDASTEGDDRGSTFMDFARPNAPVRRTMTIGW
ncbi:MAG: aldose epimerase [Actinomycetota bacterium]